MDQQAGEVMSGSVLVEQFIVKRVRKPGERMPVALLLGGEGPSDRVPVQSVVDVGIVRDVAVVVIVDERVAIDGVVEGERGNNQE